MNFEKPEKKREVMVFSCNDIQSVLETTDLLEGFFITMKMDVRHYWDDPEVEHYTARLFSSNQVLITYPSFDYTLLNCRDYMNVNAVVMDAVDNGRNYYNDQKKTGRRAWKNLLLDFSGCVLSSKDIYLAAGDDEELAMEIIPITWTHPNMPTDGNNLSIPHTDHWVGWMVARMDVKPRKVGAGKVSPTKKVSKGAAFLQQLHGGTGGTGGTGGKGDQSMPDQQKSA